MDRQRAHDAQGARGARGGQKAEQTRQLGAAGRPAGRLSAKREAILRAAVEVFLREGYARASVDAIAEEAGVAKQTVYNHFGDKERLFLAAVEGERQRVAASFTPHTSANAPTTWDVPVRPVGPMGPAEPRGPALARDAGARGALEALAWLDARAALAAYGRQVLTALLDERASALRRLIIAEAERHPSLRPACAQGEPEQLVTAGAELLRRRSEIGELTVPDPEVAARQLVALLVQRGLHASVYGTQPLTDEEAVTLCDEAAELFVRAYRA
ncbi:TetR/AcrR family transcriptional regulator [Streptomyces zagrosensis]|uniref:TetR/AcrR family transcriptional repressor of mexJK operon n=1 Tax=Streptomyces zagrosensis TaxID=1042984 RepID=A0A7W9QCZ1_9ACTN|nr:TetR/AcrR family transcriptional regulator [Streptomyces zagrosensis]MBB5936912.1 TetR/AcrR family transcriptional repressor of mexJK operon [Streptomyces zagrosensis]